MAEAKPAPGPKKRGPRFWLVRLGSAVAAPLLFLGLLEVLLRIFGFGYSPSFLISDEADSAKWRDNYRFAWAFFPRALARSPQPLRVSKEKPREVTRLILFGSSAAMGDPEPAYGMSRILEVLLSRRFPQRKFEIINVATTAINSHVALPMARDCGRLQADAWLVYMGNNEVNGPFGRASVFGSQAPSLWSVRLRLSCLRSKTGQLFCQLLRRAPANVPESWGGMEMFLEQTVRPNDPLLPRVWANFEANLQDMVDLARDQKIPILLSTVPVNLRDSAPFVSLHREGLSGAEQATWEEAFGRGRAAQEGSQWTQALTAYAEAAKIDAEYADLSYRQGQCALANNASDEAARHFQQAALMDGLRFRADPAINEAIRRVARNGATLVDSEALLRKASPHEIPGEEWFLEHVHLTFAGNYFLARCFADQLASALQLSASTPCPSEAMCREALFYTPLHEREIVRSMRQRLSAPPFASQSDQKQREARWLAREGKLSAQMAALDPRQVAERFKAKLAANPDDWLTRKQYAVLLESLGDSDGVVEQWRGIARTQPHHALAHFQIGSQLNRLKRYAEAEPALRKAVELREDFPQAWNSLGICRSHLGDNREAYSCFARAVSILPKYPEAYVNWGLVLASQSDTKAALEKYEVALQVDPNFSQAHDNLAKFHSRAGNFSLAEKHYAELARLLPNDAGAWINLGLMRLKQGLPSATDALRQGLTLDPNSETARQALEQAKALPARP